MAPAPAVSYTTLAPVIEHMPAEFFPSLSLPNKAIASLVNPQISISAEETSLIQVVVQATPEIPVAEWIQVQSTVTDLVNPQISMTTDEVAQVVGSFPLLEDNQVHQEQIVCDC